MYVKVKIVKKIGILLIFIFLNCLLDSCSIRSDNRCYDIEFTGVESYDVQNLQVAEAGDTIDVQDFAIIMQGSSDFEYCGVAFSRGASLMAEEPVHFLKNDLVDLTISSNNDLSSILPSGTDLTDSFELYRIDESCNQELGENSYCLRNRSDGNPDFTLLEVFNAQAQYGGLFSENDRPEYQYGLIWNLETVEEPSKHIFTVRFEFRNSQVIELSTSEIVLK